MENAPELLGGLGILIDTVRLIFAVRSHRQLKKIREAIGRQQTDTRAK